MFCSTTQCQNVQEHNTVSKAPMPLVMFRFAVEHTSRFIIIFLIIVMTCTHFVNDLSTMMMMAMFRII